MSEPLRALFCIGVLPDFFAAPAADFDRLMVQFRAAFDDLKTRFGLRVLGTLDDILLQNGPSTTFPWTCYILAEAPDLAAVRGLVDHVKEARIDESRLWRYAKIEARIGVPLDFGTA